VPSGTFRGAVRPVCRCGLCMDLTNKGSAACTMNGFPGVDLVGAAIGQTNYTWSLARSSARYVRVTLQPRGTAHFDISYQPCTPGEGVGIAVTKLVLTPPNTFTQAQVTWNQYVLLEDGATHPATFIGPVSADSNLRVHLSSLCQFSEAR
jgi:Protein of unknown function (DUF4232)